MLLRRFCSNRHRRRSCQSALRAILTRELGVGWDLKGNGLGEIAGMDADMLKTFSKRSVQKERAMAAAGVTGAKAANVFVLERGAGNIGTGSGGKDEPAGHGTESLCCVPSFKVTPGGISCPEPPLWVD